VRRVALAETGVRGSAYVASQPEADIESDHDSENGNRDSKNDCDTTRGPLGSPPPKIIYLCTSKVSLGFAARSVSKT